MRHAAMTGTLAQILEMDLGQIRFPNSIFFLSVFKAARKRRGTPAEDEMYGLTLPVSQGGKIHADNLGKVALRPHLRALAQSAGQRA